MKHSAKHTPTPWETVEERNDKEGITICSIESTTGRSIADARVEDATFIVRAVNAHERDQEALKKALYALTEGDQYNKAEAIAACKDAIAKAEGK